MTSTEPCPAGHWCAYGGSEKISCSGGWFGKTAAQRCPEGSNHDPSQSEFFVWMLLILLPLAAATEVAACVETRRRKKTRALGATLTTSPNVAAKDGKRGPERPDDIDAAQWTYAVRERQRGLAKHHRGKRWGGAAVNGKAKVVQVDEPVGETPSMPKLQIPAAPATPMSAKSERTPLYVSPMENTKMRTFTYFQLTDVTFKIGDATVLDTVSAHLQHGELVGLMGESGSGKTTLLNVLGGRASYGLQTGSLTLNSRPFSPRVSQHMLGYVPQAHILYKELTVYENLAYAAALRLHRDVGSERREQLIETALDLLGLQECRHFVCDPSIGERLSGGQMRRIGIGIELVCDPPIMLLDEPTSALDAVNTRLVVASLKDLARRGVLVIASLHQPRVSVYDMLDRLLLLRKGVLIYGGYRADALHYFSKNLGYSLPEHANPADFFIEIAFGFETSEKPLGDLLVAYEIAQVQRAKDDLDDGKLNVPSIRANANESDAVTKLAARLPLVPTARLAEALEAAGGHSGRAYALLITPCVEGQRGGVRDTYGRLLLESRHEAQRDAEGKGHHLLSAGDWTPAALTHHLFPQEAFSASLAEVKGRWMLHSGCSRKAKLISATFGAIAALDNETDFSRIHWPEEMLEEASSEHAATRKKSQLPPRKVDATDLGLLWHEWYHRSIHHTGTIMEWLMMKQSEERARAKAVLKLAKAMGARGSLQQSEAMDRTKSTISYRVSSIRGMSMAKRFIGGSVPNSRLPISRSPHSPRPQMSREVSIDDVETAMADPPPSPPDMVQFDDADAKSVSGLSVPVPLSHESSPVALTNSPSLDYHAGVDLDTFTEWFTSRSGFNGMIQEKVAEQVWVSAREALLESQTHRRFSLFRRLSTNSTVQELGSFPSQRGSQTPRISLSIARAQSSMAEHSAPREYELYPTWTQLRATMHHWPMPHGQSPGWLVTFSVCIQRYSTKLLRKRKSTYLLVIVTALLGLLCGSLHGDTPSRNDLTIFYLLFNCMFATVVATSTIASLGGAEDGMAFFLHEAASGVSQTAEGLSRFVLDIVAPLILLPVAFGMSLKALCNIPVSLFDLIADWWMLTFAMSPLGYLFTLLAPGNAVVLTSSVTLITTAFGTGFFGIKANLLTPRSSSLLPWLSPGAPGFFRIAFGATVAHPKAVDRSVLTNQLRASGIFASIMGDNDRSFTNSGQYIQDFEEGNLDWQGRTFAQLFVFGVTVRIVCLALFVSRNHSFPSRMSNAYKLYRASHPLIRGRKYIMRGSISASAHYASATLVSSSNPPGLELQRSSNFDPERRRSRSDEVEAN